MLIEFELVARRTRDELFSSSFGLFCHSNARDQFFFHSLRHKRAAGLKASASRARHLNSPPQQS